MPFTLIYSLTLETDVSLTARNATLGYGETLEYVPGAALLGAAARDYPAGEGDEERAWEMFHSGRLRFGCALPIFEQRLSVPMPLCLYRNKGDAKDTKLQNRLCADVTQQPEMQKDGFLAASGKRCVLIRRSSLRTAINPEEGRAREGFIFPLECVPAGSRFMGRISADSPELLAAARARLQGRSILIGRSRSAELGRAQIRFHEDGAWLQHGKTRVEKDGRGQAVFFCVSDLALRTPDGAVLLDLSPKNGADHGWIADTFGLPAGWLFDVRRSVIRTRTWAPFNGHRRRPDLQRQVIQAGSVLVFTGPVERDQAAFRDAILRKLDRGVGCWRQDGLGELWFEPEPLQGEHVQGWSAPALSEPGADPGRDALPPSDALMGWLRRQAAETKTRETNFEAIEAAATKLARLPVPKAQWGMLRQLARQYKGQELQAEIKKLIEGGARRLVWAGSPQEELMECIDKKDAVWIELLAARVPHHIPKKER